MPAKTPLKKLQDALKIEAVNSNLDSYAIGILVYEQTKFRKSQIKEQNKIEAESSAVDTSSQAVLLVDLYAQLDMGFYHTVALFHQLALTNPREAKQMIAALLSLDTIGRYLLEERPVILDGTPFVLDNVLQELNIDSVFLKERARLNQSNTVFINDCSQELQPVEPTAIVFGFPEYLKDCDESIKTACKTLERTAKSVSEGEALRKTASQFLFDFDLVSKLPTEENIHLFLDILAEIFAHAKMQDSSLLDTLDAEAPKGTKLGRYSKVSLLQNTMDSWFFYH